MKWCAKRRRTESGVQHGDNPELRTEINRLKELCDTVLGTLNRDGTDSREIDDDIHALHVSAGMLSVRLRSSRTARDRELHFRS